MTDLERRLLQSLKLQASMRDFGLFTPREKTIARHFYLLALEEVERGLAAPAETDHHAA
jgi:hypothetical protein